MLDAPALVLGVVFLFALCAWVKEQRRTTWVIVSAYCLRAAVALYDTRDVKFFSHMAGSDAITYDICAQLISARWIHTGVHFVTQDEVWIIGTNVLGANIFALITHVNGGPARLACTAFIMVIAGLTFLNFSRLAREIGADDDVSFAMTAGLSFLPSFVLYTSDMFKDGLVVFLVLGSLGSAIRLGRRFSILDLLFGALCVWALWYIRFYLVFIAVMPLLVGFLGVRTRSLWRLALFTSVLLTALVIVAAYTHVFDRSHTIATETFDYAYSPRALQDNQRGGSGVMFEDHGNPFGALPQKLVFTLLAPFPWQSGTIGFHLGKIETLLFYFVFYRAIRAAVRLAPRDPGLLLTMLAFVIPLTMAYAMTLANIGLILRQRQPIVVIVALLATLSWPHKDRPPEPEEAEEPEATGDPPLPVAVPVRGATAE